jgi:hypothetical protein
MTIKLLTVTKPSDNQTEYILSTAIESMRKVDPRQHTPEASTIIRTQSGREIAVMEDYLELTEEWELLLNK